MKKMELRRKYKEFLRFCIVGAFCTCIDAAIFYVLRTFVAYQISLVSAYVLSLILNYFLTVYWTFKMKSNVKNIIGIVLAHLFNLFIVRMGLMRLFIDTIGINDKVAYLPTLLISIVTNFMIVKLVIYKLK